MGSIYAGFERVLLIRESVAGGSNLLRQCKSYRSVKTKGQWQAVGMGHQLTDVPPDTCSVVLLKCLPAVICSEWVSGSLPRNW